MRTVVRSPTPDWFLQEWLSALGKRQASLTNELGWNKSKANFVFHGRQPYRRELVNEISAWLQIRPYELLMHPDEAMAIRRLREHAARIVADQPINAPDFGDSPNRRAS